jgi:hypothetical protein
LHAISLAEVTTKPNDTLFWKGLMKEKDDFFSRGSSTVGNGIDIGFWEEQVLGITVPLAI